MNAMNVSSLFLSSCVAERSAIDVGSNSSALSSGWRSLISCSETARAATNDTNIPAPARKAVQSSVVLSALEALEALVHAQGETTAAPSVAPAWLAAVLRNVFSVALADYEAASSESLALRVIASLRCAGLTSSIALPALISALCSATDSRVSALLAQQDGALDAAILSPALSWARDVAVPFAAHSLFSQFDLAALAIASDPQSSSKLPEADSAREKSLKASLHAANILGTPSARLPHVAIPLCYTPFSQYDDGSAVNTGCLNGARADSLDAFFSGRIIALQECVEAIFAGVHASVARVRTEQAFDIVRDFPDSAPAVGDLRDAVAAAGEGAAAVLIETLVSSLRARLLHAGVATASILDLFLSTIRMLWRIEGPGGIIASLVAEPIQAYLRTRADAIRCIVSSLTEDTSSELYAELVGRGSSGALVARGAAAANHDDDIASDGDDDDFELNTAGDDEDLPAASTTTSSALAIELDEDSAAAVAFFSHVHSVAADPGSVTPEAASLTLRLTRLLFAPRHWRVLQGDPRAKPSILRMEGSLGASPQSCWGLGTLTGNEPPWWLSSSIDSFASPQNASASSQLPRFGHYRLWQPTPHSSDATRFPGVRASGPSGSSQSLLSLLLNIYGSADLFIAEYRALLSERLAGVGASSGTSGVCTPGTWDFSNEERTVELLKLRFGEPALVGAEVMLKDVGDSKRIAAATVGALARRRTEETAATGGTATCASGLCREKSWSVDVCGGGHFEALVLSSHYWPPGALPRETTLVIHPALASIFSLVAREYNDLKKPRTIAAVSALGCIEIDVTLPADPPIIVSASGTPQQVSFLLFWVDAGGDSVPLNDVAQALHAPPAVALRLASHWVSRGVCMLQRSGDGDDSWNVCASVKDGSSLQQTNIGIDVESEVSGAPAIPAEAIEVWNSYVFGMLTNLGPLPLDRIQMTLKMFASMGDFPFDLSAAETARFLADLVRAEKIELSDSLYSIR